MEEVALCLYESFILKTSIPKKNKTVLATRTRNICYTIIVKLIYCNCIITIYIGQYLFGIPPHDLLWL